MRSVKYAQMNAPLPQETSDAMWDSPHQSRERQGGGRATLPLANRTRSQHTPGIQPPSSFLAPRRAKDMDTSRATRDLTSASQEPLFAITSPPTELELPGVLAQSRPEPVRSESPRPLPRAAFDYLRNEKGRKMRNFQTHEGGNRFFFGGRAMTSRDSLLPFIASLWIAICLPALFFVFVGSWLWYELAGGKAAAVIVAYICSIMLASMLRTAWRDPGIVPRNLHIPDTELIACHPGAAEDIGGGQAERPRARYIRVRDDSVVSKWCETCCTYRPPRTSHCRLCRNCVERTDHHCTFLNTCIGRRNYSTFLAFLVAAVIAMLLVLSLSIAFIATKRPFLGNWHMAGALAVALLTLGVGLPISGLLIYHLRLAWLGATTIERIRPKDGDGQDLYAHRTHGRNLLFAFCRPMTASSALRPRKWAVQQEAG